MCTCICTLHGVDLLWKLTYVNRIYFERCRAQGLDCMLSYEGVHEKKTLMLRADCWELSKALFRANTMGFTYIHVYKYTYIHICTIHISICRYTYIHICIYIYTYTYMYICTYICTYIHTYINRQIHAYIHTNMHTYRHTNIQTAKVQAAPKLHKLP